MCQCRFVVAGALRTSCSQVSTQQAVFTKWQKASFKLSDLRRGSICMRLLLFVQAGIAIKKKRIEKLPKSRGKSVETLCK